MDNISVFERVEKKYNLTQEQYVLFLAMAGKYIEEDQFGLHTIHNIYYDTTDYGLIRNSLEKPKYKEKFRLRGYGNIGEDSEVFLEIKKKYAGIVYKRRTCMSYPEARRYLKDRAYQGTDNQILREINYFMEFYKPEPKVYLAYDRVAYVGKEDAELRITIDRNIRSRYDKLELGYDEECNLLSPGVYLMEIKVPVSYPVWLAEMLAELQIFPVSFSKYGNVYADAVLSGELHPWANHKTEILSQDNRQEREEKEPCLQVYSAV